ncbi:MAG TPA: glycosyltransferase family 2 protein [Cyclobacteriaceae bacterium]
MKASIIIPTYQGVHKIRNLLSGLMKQTERDFELIVVIDGSTDNTLEVVKSYEHQFEDFKVIFQENKGRSCTRNLGASQARSEILIFYDDDVIPMENSVKKHIDFHKKMPDCLVSGNPVEIQSVENSDIQNYKVQLSKKWIAKYPDGLSKMDVNNLFFSSANCSMRTITFSKLNGFDERLTDVEDFDLAFRALKQGLGVYFDKANDSIHCDKITAASYVKRLRQYSVARQRWNEIHSIKSNRVKVGWKSLFYLLFASSLWITAIDREFFLRIPGKLRYKLYDIIIQSMAIEFPKSKLT